jgi:Gluconate 2-dehydrogenase subunit 3
VIDRRSTLKWMLAASASMPLLHQRVLGGDDVAAEARAAAQAAARVTAQGYGTDPDLLKTFHPGEPWPLTLNDGQRLTAAALSDIILPADARSPGASAVGVVDFLDEWVSAPYPTQMQDRALLLDGLAWIDAEAMRRFARTFSNLDETQQHAICDDICHEKSARPSFAEPARFFARYRDLTAGGFYSTAVGRRDLGYMGNDPRASFDGPVSEVLRTLGLDEPT